MRTKKANNIELKYKLYIFDFRRKEYIFFDNYVSLRTMAEFLNIKYNILTEIYNNRSKGYIKFLKIELIPK
jgi:hypothetical protein